MHKTECGAMSHCCAHRAIRAACDLPVQSSVICPVTSTPTWRPCPPSGVLTGASSASFSLPSHVSFSLTFQGQFGQRPPHSFGCVYNSPLCCLDPGPAGPRSLTSQDSPRNAWSPLEAQPVLSAVPSRWSEMPTGSAHHREVWELLGCCHDTPIQSLCASAFAL